MRHKVEDIPKEIFDEREGAKDGIYEKGVG